MMTIRKSLLIALLALSIAQSATLVAVSIHWTRIADAARRGDITRDGQVDAVDLSILLAHWTGKPSSIGTQSTISVESKNRPSCLQACASATLQPTTTVEQLQPAKAN